MSEHMPNSAKGRPVDRRGSIPRTAKFYVLSSLMLAVFVAGGGWAIWEVLPDAEARSKTAVDLPAGIGFIQKLNASVPADIPFVDSEGNETTLREVMSRGRPILLNLVYFQCPMLCNMSMDAVVRTLNTMELRVGRDFEVVTISFDPTEKPALAAGAKRTTIKRYGDGESSGGWHFWCGSEESIDVITDAIGFNYAYDEASGQYAHAAGITILTPEGRISRYLTGIDYSARDLRLALVESSQEKIGSPTDQVLLLCFSYDPLSGKYGLAISRAIQIFGLLTVACLVGGITIMIRREQVAKPTEPATTQEE